MSGKMVIVLFFPSFTLIGKVLGYDSGGFVEIFSTFRFRSDCDVTVGAGWVTSCLKESWWLSVPIPHMKSDQWRHVTKIFASKVNYPGVRLRRFCGNFFQNTFQSWFLKLCEIRGTIFQFWLFSILIVNLKIAFRLGFDLVNQKSDDSLYKTIFWWQWLIYYDL